MGSAVSKRGRATAAGVGGEIATAEGGKKRVWSLVLAVPVRGPCTARATAEPTWALHRWGEE